MTFTELQTLIPELTDIFNEATEINASGYFTYSEKRMILSRMKARAQKIKMTSSSPDVRKNNKYYDQVLNVLSINLGL